MAVYAELLRMDVNEEFVKVFEVSVNHGIYGEGTGKQRREKVSSD
jgi:hypothetical protein